MLNNIEVKILLIRKCLTQVDIAKACDVSTMAISNILCGQRPGYKHQGRIARMLGIKKADLFGSNDKRKPRGHNKRKFATRLSRGGAA